MRSVREIIRAQHQSILQLWSEQAGRAASAKGLSAPALHNVLPRYLLSLADLSEEARPQRRKLLESHLATRIRQGFLLPEITEEILLLGACIADACRSLSKEERGLGLTLVKGSVEAMGGSVSVESGEGSGTTFHVDLPLDGTPHRPA